MTVCGLDEIDPRTVALPHGTEVKTRIARSVPGSNRVIPQGAVGRVIAIDGPAVTLRVVGVGEVVYQREEIRPRNRGQLRFALDRAAAEEALTPCVVLEATVGSRAWGLADEGSDQDLRGVFLHPFTWSIGLAPTPEVVVSADGSATYWELERTIRQALRADPNTLEMLYVPQIEAKTEVGEALLAARNAFPSTKIYGSFGRYALAQAKKLEQSRRLAEHRGLVLDWLRQTPSLSLDQTAERLRQAAVADDGGDGTRRARQYLKQLYRSMHDQGLLEASSFEALIDFARERAMDFELPRELRPKNAYNLLRIVSCAVHWLSTGEPLIEVEGELKERLKAIKAGAVPLETSLRWTEQAAEDLDAARTDSPLPPGPDLERADTLLRRARELAARDWLAGTPGPWGRDAPEPPRPRLDREREDGDG